MIVAYPTPVEVVYQSPQLLLAVARNFDLNKLSNGAYVRTDGYAVGSIFARGTKGSVNTAVLTVKVSNHFENERVACDAVAAHPTATTLSLVATDGLGTTTDGMALEHMYFGVEVTTIQSGNCDLYFCLKA